VRSTAARRRNPAAGVEAGSNEPISADSAVESRNAEPNLTGEGLREAWLRSMNVVLDEGVDNAEEEEEDGGYYTEDTEGVVVFGTTYGTSDLEEDPTEEDDEEEEEEHEGDDDWILDG